MQRHLIPCSLSLSYPFPEHSLVLNLFSEDSKHKEETHSRDMHEGETMISLMLAYGSEHPDTHPPQHPLLSLIALSAPIQTRIQPVQNQKNGILDSWNSHHLSLCASNSCGACPMPFSPTLPWPLTQFIFLLAPEAIFHHPAGLSSTHFPKGFVLPTSSVSLMLLLLELDPLVLFLDSFHWPLLD